jgi:hypothetical protein
MMNLYTNQPVHKGEFPGKQLKLFLIAKEDLIKEKSEAYDKDILSQEQLRQMALHALNVKTLPNKLNY